MLMMVGHCLWIQSIMRIICPSDLVLIAIGLVPYPRHGTAPTESARHLRQYASSLFSQVGNLKAVLVSTGHS
jgi:hypothetical protein